MPARPKPHFIKPLHFVFLLSFFIALTAFECEDSECNYITDYYQLVYDAQLEYLKENYDSAYLLLKEAKAKCELLNQPETRETVVYAALCARKGFYDEAFHHLEKVLKDGFKLEYLEHNNDLTLLHEHPGWALLKEKAARYEQEFKILLTLH